MSVQIDNINDTLTISKQAEDTVTIGTTGAVTVNVAANSSAKLGFYGATAATRPANTVKARTVLGTLGLMASGGTDTTFYKDADQTLSDGVDIAVGTTTGTKIATNATTQKLGFWNVTPVVQPTNAAQAAIGTLKTVTATNTTDTSSNITTNFNTIKTLVNRLRTDLIAVGIIKGS